MKNHHFAYLLIASLTLAAGPIAVISASPARDPIPDVDILVKDAPRPRYAHDGRWYVEALKGQEYAIRLGNPYPVRVAVALSVDGLNTIDARETTAADARKWVLAPHKTVTISGWQTSRTKARRFEFTTEARSYGQSIGKTANMGMISAVFFKGRVRIDASDRSNAFAGRRAPAPSSAPIEQEASDAVGTNQKAVDEYAATGMGRPTDHAVRQVWLDLEDTPAQVANIRYEFRPQLVKLGILPPAPTTDTLQRRERARGFEPSFCPEPAPQR